MLPVFTKFLPLMKFPPPLVLAAMLGSSLTLRSQSPGPIQPISSVDAALHDEYTIPLGWNQATLNVNVSVKNTTGQALQVFGVQSSSGVWVTDYPRSIPAKGSASLAALVEAKPGLQSDVEIVRLKTGDGEKTLLLKLDRPPLVALDSSRLRWSQGEAAISKSVVLTLGNPAVSLKSVSTVSGHAVVFRKQGTNTYLITVTPKSTAKAGVFPVLVALDPLVPGVAPAITCTIAATK